MPHAEDCGNSIASTDGSASLEVTAGPRSQNGSDGSTLDRPRPPARTDRFDDLPIGSGPFDVAG